MSVSYRTSTTLVCGLSLLRQFTPERPERGIAELAVGMEVSRPTAHRYASTCLELGYVTQVRKRRYRLTRRSAAPGMAALATLRASRAGEPILRELREATERTIALAVLDGVDVLYLQRHRGYHRGEYQLERGWGAGSRRPARDTAAGRALLAAESESDGKSDELAPIVDDRALPGRARGLAITVRARGERTSAIELTAPATSIGAEQLLARYEEPLRAAGAALRAALGENHA
jgi:IclR family pca regulon transcriptional regulator